MMNKEYTPLIVGIVLYLLMFLITRVTQSGFVDIVAIAAGFLIFPIIIGYLARDYVRAIIYAIISVTVMGLINYVTNPYGVGLMNLVVSWVMVAIFSVVGVFVALRLVPKSAINNPTP